jgi:uncharacterized protein (UPF0179 family)
MSESNRKTGRLFTLLDPDSAKPGKTWRYIGEPEECVSCSVRGLCHGSLYPGMIFEVFQARKAKNYCKLRDFDIESVEIRRPKAMIAIDSRLAKEGALTEYNRKDCLKMDCPFVELCNPFELEDGEKIKVIEISKSFPCPIAPDRSLSIVRVEPV